MASNIECFLISDNDVQEVVEFYNAIHKTQRTISNFEWEFKRGPAGPAIYIIAKDIVLNIIIGTQCAIPIFMVDGNGNEFLTAKSEDTLIHPNYRGKGIFEMMYAKLIEECKQNGIVAFWGFTSAVKPFSKLGFTIPFIHTQTLKAFDVINSYRYLSSLNKNSRFLHKLKILGLCFYSKYNTFNNLKRIDNYQEKFKCRIIDSFDELNYPEKVNVGIEEFGLLLNKEFLKWRISNNPYYLNNITIEYTEKGKPVGYLTYTEIFNGIWVLANEVYSQVLHSDSRIYMLFNSLQVLKNSNISNFYLIRTYEFTHNDFSVGLLDLKEKNGFTHLNKGISFVWLTLDDKFNKKLENIQLNRLAFQH